MTAQKERPRQPNKQQRKNLYLLGATISTVIAVCVPLLGRDLDQPILASSFLAATAATLAFSLLWFGALDELAQRAHYEAWFWGGSIGLLLLPLLSVAALLTGSRADWIDYVLMHIGGRDDARLAFLNGVVVAIVPPVIGYGIWWLVFWLRKL